MNMREFLFQPERECLYTWKSLHDATVPVYATNEHEANIEAAIDFEKLPIIKLLAILAGYNVYMSVNETLKGGQQN